MPNKFFNVQNPQQIVTIVDDKDKFYELSDGSMIKKETFTKNYQPVLESLDPLNPELFFNTPTLSDDVISGIKEADASKATDFDDTQRSTVKYNTTDQTKNPTQNNSLVKPIQESNIPNIPNNTNTDVSQYKVYDDDDEAYKDFLKKNQSGQKPSPPPQIDIVKQKQEIENMYLNEKMAFGDKEAIARRKKRLEKLPQQQQQQIEQEVEMVQSELGVEYTPTTPTAPTAPAQLNPIEMMFSTFKRKHKITINIEFEDMIGDPDFVKLMVENMDGDIVGYYKNLIMKNIMGDLSKIEKAVEKTIQFEIFGEDVEEEKSELIPSGKTKAGKQKYKYIDENGKIKELLPNTAKNKGYEPLKTKK